jgi:hypothetical protein
MWLKSPYLPMNGKVRAELGLTKPIETAIITSSETLRLRDEVEQSKMNAEGVHPSVNETV